ncbi:MAG: hypothetical protein K0R24_1636 [Gammaproteobacteria bacterium]|jgi:mRNA interferase MazF|nr:hypothetical protein [Gammaproteobacteria bacterium]
MIYKPFSIVTVPFPFTDKNATKRRPALVLSSVEHQRQTHHVTLMMITTAKKSAWWNDYPIKSLQNTGLPMHSIIRQKVFTLDFRLIIKSIGCLTNTDIIHVTKLIKKHFEL